jgi:putative peptidoglycan lipid II flippase
VLHGIVGASYSMAAFPTLARLFKNKEDQKFLDMLRSSANHIIFWSMPFLSLFIVLRAQIVRVILGSGQFNWEDTRLTAATLAIFSVSIIAQGVIVLLTRAFYARGKTYLPLFSNVFGAILIPIFTFSFLKIFESSFLVKTFFESLLRISDLEVTSVIVLPIGYTIGTILNAIFLWVMFRFEIKKWDIGVVSNLLHSFCASVLGGTAAYLFLNFLDDFLNLNKTWGIFIQGFVSGFIGLLVIYLFLKILKSSVLMETERAIIRFMESKVKPVGSDIVDGQNL